MFCKTCKSLMKIVDNVWICRRCGLKKETSTSSSFKQINPAPKQTSYEKTEKKLFKTFDYNGNSYIFFENWRDIKDSGFSLEDYIGVVCSKTSSTKRSVTRKKFLCIELKYFNENRQEMVPIKTETIEDTIKCNETSCGAYCLFYPENLEEFNAKLSNHINKNSNAQRKRRYNALGKDLENRI